MRDCGCDEKTVRDVIGETAELPKLRKPDKAAAEHATEFEPPIYNIWKQQKKSKGSSHFGNTPSTRAGRSRPNRGSGAGCPNSRSQTTQALPPNHRYLPHYYHTFPNDSKKQEWW